MDGREGRRGPRAKPRQHRASAVVDMTARLQCNMMRCTAVYCCCQSAQEAFISRLITSAKSATRATFEYTVYMHTQRHWILPLYYFHIYVADSIIANPGLSIFPVSGQGLAAHSMYPTRVAYRCSRTRFFFFHIVPPPLFATWKLRYRSYAFVSKVSLIWRCLECLI